MRSVWREKKGGQKGVDVVNLTRNQDRTKEPIWRMGEPIGSKKTQPEKTLITWGVRKLTVMCGGKKLDKRSLRVASSERKRVG